jgi:hypothetical protein
MVDIEPFPLWRDSHYISEEDRHSPFYGRAYNDFVTENMVYNYYIHPRWDFFGSETLYGKILFADYDKGTAIIEFIGEWNDAINNDIMHLKRNVIEKMLDEGISKYVLILENVLNFHTSDDEYYTEWAEECQDALDGGWIAMLNIYDHVYDELKAMRLDNYVAFGQNLNGLNWRQHSPKLLIKAVESLMEKGTKRIK